MLLNIFHTGGLTLGVSLVFWFLIIIFSYQAYKAHNSGWVRDTRDGHEEGKEKISYWKIPFTYAAIGCFVGWIVALLIIASDYKGV